jgi:hypothetical protein
VALYCHSWCRNSCFILPKTRSSVVDTVSLSKRRRASASCCFCRTVSPHIAAGKRRAAPSFDARCRRRCARMLIATDVTWCHQQNCNLHGKQIRRFAQSLAADTGMCLHYSLFCYTFILQKAAFMDVSCLTAGVVKFNIAVPAGKSVVRLTRCTGEVSYRVLFVCTEPSDLPPVLTFRNSTFCPHNLFMWFVWI